MRIQSPGRAAFTAACTLRKTGRTERQTGGHGLVLPLQTNSTRGLWCSTAGWEPTAPLAATAGRGPPAIARMRAPRNRNVRLIADLPSLGNSLAATACAQHNSQAAL